MTLENCKRLVEHYKALIENPDRAFPPNAKVKPQGRESVIAEAKKALEDMEINIRIREEISKNPNKRLAPEVVMRKLLDKDEAIEKGVIQDPEKEKTKKSK